MPHEIVKFSPDLISAEHMSWEASAPLVAPRAYDALSFRMKGSAQIKISGSLLNANEGSVLYLPGGLEYAAVYSDTEILCFHFRSAAAGCTSGQVAGQLAGEYGPRVYGNADRFGVNTLFSDACRAWRQKMPGYELHTLGLFYQVLAALKRMELAADCDSDRLAGAVRILDREFADPSLRISDVCRRAGLCETAFRAMFRQYYAKSPVQYLTERRLEKAKSLLMRRSVSVERAAIESGFRDAKYFSRVVKKTYGCTPSALRRRFV